MPDRCTRAAGAAAARRRAGAGQGADQDMAWVPGGELPDGVGGLLPGGAPGAPGRGRRLLDRRAPGDRRRVPPVRAGDRVRHRGRAAARPGAVPRRRPGAAAPGLAGLLPDQRAGRPARLAQWWRVHPGRQTGATRAGPAARWTAWTGTRSPTWPPRTPTRTPPGRARSCPPRPNGSSPPAAAWTGAVFAWGDDPRPAGRVDGQHLAGRVPVAEPQAAAASSGRPRSGASRPTATGSTTWPATSGSGRATTSSRRPAEPRPARCCAPRNPRVDRPRRRAWSPGEPGAHIPRRVIKGGSHLCAPNYCLRYRPAARQGEAVDTSTAHLGFRCVARGAGTAGERPDRRPRAGRPPPAPPGAAQACRAAWTLWRIAVGEVALRSRWGHPAPAGAARRLAWPGGYDAGAAQATLAAIAGGMITLTGFVLTAVTLIVQTMQGQSPRLLRVLDRTDRTPLLFGTFMATFTFALVALSQVHVNACPKVLTSPVLLVLREHGLFLRLLVIFRTALPPAAWSAVGQRAATVDLQVLGAGTILMRRRRCARAAPAGPSVAWVAPGARPGCCSRSTSGPRSRLAAGRGRGARSASSRRSATSWSPARRWPRGPGRRPPRRDWPGWCASGRPARWSRTRPTASGCWSTSPSGPCRPRSTTRRARSRPWTRSTTCMHRLAGRSPRRRSPAGRRGGAVRVRYPAPRWDTFVAVASTRSANGGGQLQVSRRLRALLDDLLAAAPPGRRTAVADRLATLRPPGAPGQPDPARPPSRCGPTAGHRLPPRKGRAGQGDGRPGRPSDHRASWPGRFSGPVGTARLTRGG